MITVTITIIITSTTIITVTITTITRQYDLAQFKLIKLAPFIRLV